MPRSPLSSGYYDEDGMPPQQVIFSQEGMYGRELRSMGAVLVASGIIGFGLLVYLFYVLFKGEDL